jgi:hypothetical protein
MKSALTIRVFKMNEGRFVQIVGQKYRCESFSTDGSNFRSTNGFTLRSQSVPQADDNALFVRGSDTKRDSMLLCVPSDEWIDKLSHAVNEYNQSRDLILSRNKPLDGPPPVIDTYLIS